MTGTIALHGGGEFLPGDERSLAAILLAVGALDRAVRVTVVPTAAARGRPDLAAADGVAALQRAGATLGVAVEAEPALIVDTASAADPGLAATLEAADLVYLPGGDPDLIPALYPGTIAWAAISAAWSGGAVLAGASAGAMALGAVTWTPTGLVAGLGQVPGIVVVPHADARSWSARLARFRGDVPADIGVLGIGERTAVLISPGAPWLVVGQEEVRWLAPGVRDLERVIVARDGDVVDPAAR